MAHEDTTIQINYFFDWFRDRCEAIKHLGRLRMPPGMEEIRPNVLPDQAVLISAGIDSLASHWKRMYTP